MGKNLPEALIPVSWATFAPFLIGARSEGLPSLNAQSLPRRWALHKNFNFSRPAHLTRNDDNLPFFLFSAPNHPDQITMSSKAQPTTKKFGKSTRTVPHPSDKAQKWYPAVDESKPKKVRENDNTHINTQIGGAIPTHFLGSSGRAGFELWESRTGGAVCNQICDDAGGCRGRHSRGGGGMRWKPRTAK